MNVALCPQRLDILSLCTGGGGLDLGVELALPSARIVCMVEREAFSVAHLVSAMEQGLLAPAPVWSDARTFAGRPWRGCVDGLIGGIPCQPHSVAGLRLAEEDERDLWGPTRRIIVQARPWFVVIENVDGMLSSGGGERVWRDLGRLGFEVEIGLFTASEVGLPHERERVFILGVSEALADACSPRFQGGELGRPSRALDREPAPRSAAEFRPALFPPGPEDAGWPEFISRAPHLEPGFRRVADGLATVLDFARLERVRQLGNGVVPLEAGYALRTLATRLAARSAGAARLRDLMEAA